MGQVPAGTIYWLSQVLHYFVLNTSTLIHPWLSCCQTLLNGTGISVAPSLPLSQKTLIASVVTLVFCGTKESLWYGVRRFCEGISYEAGSLFSSLAQARGKMFIASVLKALATSSVPPKCQTSYLFAWFVLSEHMQEYVMRPELGLYSPAKALATFSLTSDGGLVL